MIQDKIFFDEKDPTGLSYNTPFTYFGSYQGRLWSKAPGGEIKYYTQNSDLSVYATTGSNQFNGNQAITGSLTVTGGIIGTAATSSYVEYSNVANKPTLVSGSAQVSFSGITNKPTLVSGSAQVSFSGITNKPTLVSSSVQVKEYNVFATTGSNGFNGSQSITGSLTVTGQVVAQTLNVQQVTSSIVYSSGSNIFGNNSSNNHRFTGSVNITGSLSVNGAGTFSSTVTSTIFDSTSNAFRFNGSNALSLVTLSGQNVVKINAAGYWGVQLVGANDQGILVNNVGNFGIGTTSPQALLTVAGTNQSLGGAFNTYGNAFISTNNSPAINNGGSISFGARYFTGNTTLATFGRIHGKKEDATDGSTAGYLSFETTREDGAQLFERMRITSAGNVGIGTDSPDTYSFGGNRRFLTVSNTSTGGEGVLQVISSTDGNGNIDFGSSSVLRCRIIGFNSSALGFFTNGTNSGTGATERMRITSGGYLKASNDGTYSNVTGTFHEFRTSLSNNNVVYFVNTASSNPYGPYINFLNAAPNDSTRYFLSCNDTGGDRFIARSNGGLANYAANNVNLSDERTKKNIIPLESYWDKFKAIEIVKFKYKDQTHDDFNIGVIAQQVESVAPEFVDVDGWNTKPELDEEGNEIVSTEEPLKSIYTADLYHATIKVLQEAMSKIETLEAKIQTLEQQ